ncbi:MAG TPA: LytTR family transcriptional regulator DNA-binding domain-containing protein [Bacteroidales bacterium]|nr:LytTR family transcriptional regulator DNA-binding domain-containing protein [Bacteroidales bacterium]HPF01599.1 LytTR family transcriptional regulator DNA-binding domain-containing protein [Bacteroidales bacterium]HPJ59330.1 LytTR family transcriptional regulator DNA-binding domain-containing protein [Bacteroidales bacterium]HPR13210.1 LytTR family transcriptional regulator DNA-binding domain-containing protein [Bacteroidales bacterium]HRW83951.1 LytTR family transcriptional regulator DNA-b
MDKIRTLIIEDETPAREILKHYLRDYPELDIIAECADGFSGLKTITEMKPDLVFLDIQMPRLTGFEMIEVMTEKPVIIFTTAYDQFAIKAFEMNAIDYLLKPYPKERLRGAILKAKDKLGRMAAVDQDSLPGLFGKLPPQDEPINRIVVRKGNSISIITVDQLRYLEAEDDYVMVHHSAGKALKQQPMKYFEENLPASDFVRIHRSYIVKVTEIKRIEPYGKDSHVAVLHAGEKLPVSRSGYKHLREELKF